MRKYLVWSNHDPNDSFVIEVSADQDPVAVALDEVGYSISTNPIKEEEEEEDDEVHS